MLTERDKVSHALIQYDEREAKKSYHNPYAIGHYLAALEKAESAVSSGATWRDALMSNFNGKLLSAVLRSIGEKPASKEETQTRDLEFFRNAGL